MIPVWPFLSKARRMNKTDKTFRRFLLNNILTGLKMTVSSFSMAANFNYFLPFFPEYF